MDSNQVDGTGEHKKCRTQKLRKISMSRVYVDGKEWTIFEHSGSQTLQVIYHAMRYRDRWIRDLDTVVTETELLEGRKPTEGAVTLSANGVPFDAKSHSILLHPRRVEDYTTRPSDFMFVDVQEGCDVTGVYLMKVSSNHDPPIDLYFEAWHDARGRIFQSQPDSDKQYADPSGKTDRAPLFYRELPFSSEWIESSEYRMTQEPRWLEKATLEDMFHKTAPVASTTVPERDRITNIPATMGTQNTPPLEPFKDAIALATQKLRGDPSLINRFRPCILQVAMNGLESFAKSIEESIEQAHQKIGVHDEYKAYLPSRIEFLALECCGYDLPMENRAKLEAMGCLDLIDPQRRNDPISAYPPPPPRLEAEVNKISAQVAQMKEDVSSLNGMKEQSKEMHAYVSQLHDHIQDLHDFKKRVEDSVMGSSRTSHEDLTREARKALIRAHGNQRELGRTKNMLGRAQNSISRQQDDLEECDKRLREQDECQKVQIEHLKALRTMIRQAKPAQAVAVSNVSVTGLKREADVAHPHEQPPAKKVRTSIGTLAPPPPWKD